MSAFVSKITDFVRNAIRTVTAIVRRSPGIAAIAAAVLVMLFLV